MPVVSISDAQRRPLPQANWQETVYHGLSDTLFSYNSEPDDYLAFLGRISPEKRVDRAVEIAGRAELPLKVAAKVDPVDQEYFETNIEPLFEADHVEFLGEIDEREKQEFLGNARALLCPIDWPEPFGLVLIEALACGTPVIAFPHGSIPELIDDGVSGFVVDTVDEAVEAVGRLPNISRATCRQVFEDRFTVPRMARDYLRVYERILAERSSVV
jgi:glycosyltransferase involved in cell wall biosynthesis